MTYEQATKFLIELALTTGNTDMLIAVKTVMDFNSATWDLKEHYKKEFDTLLELSKQK